MSHNPHKYLLADAAPLAEVRRLERIDQYMGATTERHLTRLGLTAGWRCLEVGAGVGGVARFMADRVGLGGRVTATDLTPLFLPDSALPQLEIRRHDILTDGLEPEYYDLVHCRLLLANVGDVEHALQQMLRALRPGGWLVVEEPGDGRLPAVGESNPDVAEYNRLMAEFLDAVEGTRAVELGLYRRLPRLLQELGLVDVGGEHTQLLVDGDGRAAVAATLQAVRPMLASSAFLQDGRLDRLVALCAEPALLTMGGATLSMWGRRAA